MKMMLVSAVFATLIMYATCVLPTVSQDDHLLVVLQAMHHSNTFRQLPTMEKVILVEMLAAAESDQITHYVDTIGFDRVLLFLDHVNRYNQTEAHLLEKYLIQELAEEETTPSATTFRRSLQSVIHTITSNDAFQHLSDTDQTLMLDLAEAAEHGNATALVNQVGYSKILALVEHIMSPAETHVFLQYLVSHIEKELGHNHHHGPVVG
ncbi:uncharacterized protein LOC110450103 [Mizuhopecten yessoensis]|uniref:Uncharacterized protein n=1 Tax=Mizuhopecten yessoensis TaxID=6573 RepID=A0A210QPP6_MIZYE|nr:uncharacterized protein LOC110450103 [Mizuhopecten yessoensis]OWF50705.1 hypothetical protein KP79_PYT18347 [Mizuhopecten yessoensis]